MLVHKLNKNEKKERQEVFITKELPLIWVTATRVPSYKKVTGKNGRDRSKKKLSQKESFLITFFLSRFNHIGAISAHLLKFVIREQRKKDRLKKAPRFEETKEERQKAS